MNIEMTDKDIMVLKLLHYFITEQNYSPVIVHGVQNEIWLENMDSEYKIVRIVSNYILNDEQMNFDMFKTKRIVKSIKRKTFNLNMNVLNIFTDLGDDVKLVNDKHISSIDVKDENDIKNYDFLSKYYPDIDKKLIFNEEGVNLFMKITEDINKKNTSEAKKVNDIFAPKKVIITYILIAINVLVFLFGFLFNKFPFLINNFSTYGPFIKAGQYYRLLTGAFLHVSIIHLFVNMYALYVLGSQAEKFFGKFKFSIIYLFSAITGSLLSILLNGNVASIGASGAIFGLLGAMLYFGYNFRVYLGNTLAKQIIYVIVANFIISLLVSNIDIFGHLGGLVGGLLIAMALGFITRTKAVDTVNGVILTILYLGFLIYMNFIY